MFIFNKWSPYLVKYIPKFYNKMIIIPAMCFNIIEVVGIKKDRILRK